MLFKDLFLLLQVKDPISMIHSAHPLTSEINYLTLNLAKSSLYVENWLLTNFACFNLTQPIEVAAAVFEFV